MTFRVWPRLFDAAAAISRATPYFRGKRQAVDAIHRFFEPRRTGADSLCTVRMRDGSLMIWDVRDAAERRAAWLGTWDDSIRDAVLTQLAPDAVVLDVGANVGAWTVPLARRRGRVAHVHAFEPVPGNRARLEQVLAANAISSVTVWPLALGDDEDVVRMWLRVSVTGAESGTAAVVAPGEGHIDVPMRPLDSWARDVRLCRLDFVKLDVEGMELLVLAGAKDTVQRFRPMIVAEFDAYWLSTHGQSRADAAAWAAASGYRMQRWDRRKCRFLPTEQPDGDATLMVPAERT